MKSFLLALLLVFTAFSQAQNKKPDYSKRLKGVEKELNEVLKTWKAPGFAIAVIDQDRIIYAKGFGYQDYDNKVPVTTNTLFAIGSCTKAFTVSLMGMLADEKKVDLDEKPSTYIPDFKFYNDAMNNTITIKDMMAHRTGLPRHDLSWYLFPSASKDSLIQRIAYQEPFAGVRERWYYNNFMYLTQGVIIEKVTDKSWEDNVRERILKPLGMKRTNVTIAEMKSSDDAAWGYTLQKDSLINKTDYYDISGMSPAGSINSSVNDMSRWVRTWINGGKWEDEQVIPNSFVQQAMSSQMVINGAPPSKENPDLHLSNYGYGWMISSYKGHYRVEHGGNIDGFSANTAFYPSDSLGIVVLTNQNGSQIPSLVRNIVADRILNVKKTDWNGDAYKDFLKAKEAEKASDTISETATIVGTKPVHPFKDYIGKYSNPGYGSLNMVVQNDSIFSSLKNMKLYLKHKYYDIFEPFEVTETGIDTTEAGPVRFNFSTNDMGEVSGFHMQAEPTLDPIFFKRSPNLIKMESADLEKYVGEFELGGMTVDVHTKEDGLFLTVPGQPEYHLLPIDTNLFAIEGLDGYKLEFLSTNDLINQVKFIQPNGTFIATRK